MTLKKISTLVLAAAFTISPVIASASVDITLSGGGVTVTQGSNYSEPGYSAFSSFDGDVTSGVNVSGANTNTVGSFQIQYSVTDSNLDTAIAFRSLTIVGIAGGVMPYCSGPLAPGWVNGAEGGGCGSTGVVIQAGQSVFRNGVLHTCSDFFRATGCFIK